MWLYNWNTVEKGIQQAIKHSINNLHDKDNVMARKKKMFNKEKKEKKHFTV